MASITTDYAKCTDVALANFETDEKTQKAVEVFYSAMIKNIRRIIDLEEKEGSEKVTFSIDLMGKEVLVGYLLKSFTEVSTKYQSDKKAMKENNEWDWRQTNKELWSRHGCNTIYNSLKK